MSWEQEIATYPYIFGMAFAVLLNGMWKLLTKFVFPRLDNKGYITKKEYEDTCNKRRKVVALHFARGSSEFRLLRETEVVSLQALATLCKVFCGTNGHAKDFTEIEKKINCQIKKLASAGVTIKPEDWPEGIFNSSKETCK